MKVVTLPMDISLINSSEEIVIDLSEINFPASSPDQQKRASFIFLRNSGIKATLDFSKCSYLDKEAFLLLYLMEDIDIDASILTTTWIEILSARDGGGIYLPSILDEKELNEFIQKNDKFIKEIYQLINSLPLYAMMTSGIHGSPMDLSGFKKTDYDKIKLSNFHKLADYDQFILLLNPELGGEPLFYEKLFNKSNRYLWKMMQRLPFINLLYNLLIVPQEQQQEMIKEINNLLINNPKEVGTT